MRALLVTLASAVLLAAPARAEPLDLAQVRERLLAFHEPPSAAFWREAGESARGHLLAIARDPAERTQPRARALQALGAFDDPEVAGALRAVAGDPNERVIFRAVAVEALGDSQGERALDVLGSAAASARAPIRESAVRALRGIDAPRARGLLSTLAHDAAPEVRSAAAEALK